MLEGGLIKTQVLSTQQGAGIDKIHYYTYTVTLRERLTRLWYWQTLTFVRAVIWSAVNWLSLSFAKPSIVAAAVWPSVLPSMTDKSRRGIQLPAVCVYVPVGDVHAHHCFYYYSQIFIDLPVPTGEGGGQLGLSCHVSVAFTFDVVSGLILSTRSHTQPMRGSSP